MPTCRTANRSGADMSNAYLGGILQVGANVDDEQLAHVQIPGRHNHARRIEA